MADLPSTAGQSRAPRVLIVNYHFPPDGSVGGLRWAGFAKYLARAGWDVHVLTSAVQAGSAAGAEFKVHVVVRARTLNDVYQRLAVKLRGARARTSRNSAASNESRVGLLQRIRADISAWMAFPDDARGWVIRAGLRARRLVGQLHPDVVITSGPPHTAHLVGVLATLGRATPTVVDLRDPWHSFLPRKQVSKVSDGVLRRGLVAAMERIVFRRATGIITNTLDFSKILSRRYPHFAVKWIPNGIDPELIVPTGQERFPGLSVAYVGTLYVGRDLGPVLQGLSHFFRNNPGAARDGSMLRIAGHMTDVHEARLQTQLEECGARDFVELLGVIEARAALDLLERSSVAIVLAQEQGLQVPAKMYESVGMGVPTLVITEPDSAAAKEATRIGAIVVPPDDIAGISRVFEQTWTGQLPSRSEPLAAIDYPQLSVQMSDAILGFISAGSLVDNTDRVRRPNTSERNVVKPSRPGDAEPLARATMSPATDL